MTNDVQKPNIASAFKHLGVGPSLGSGITAGFTWIGTKGKVFSLRHEGETKLFLDAHGNPSQHLDVVIVGMNPNISKIFYLGNYSENSANPPDCASINGDVPDSHVPMPQSKSCHTCKHNEWGSGNGRGKACQDHRRLAVLLLPYMTKGMLEKPLNTPVFLKVPPDSLKALKMYGDSLSYTGTHWATIITRISFDPKELFRMNFKLLQPLTNAEAPVVLPLLDSPLTRNIVGGTGEMRTVPQIPETEEADDDVPADTGLVAAFGGIQDNAVTDEGLQPPKKGPGRPKGSVNKPKVVQATPPEDGGLVETTEEAAPSGEGSPWEEEESDSEVSKRVASLLQQKTDRMLK